MESAFNQVIASYHRARETGLLFDTFYELFLVKSPDIPPMFAGPHFAHQKLMRRESILELLVFAQTGHGEAEISRLAERHRKLNVRPIHYELWLDSLCEALAKHDPKFGRELEQQWRQSMRQGIELMSK